MLLHAVTFTVSSSVFVWQLVGLLQSDAFYLKSDKSGNYAQRLDHDLRIQVLDIFLKLANTVNRALIYYVYWNFANMCYIMDALQRPALES